MVDVGDARTRPCRVNHLSSPLAHAVKAPGTLQVQSETPCVLASGRSWARHPSVEPNAEAIRTITDIWGSATRYGQGRKRSVRIRTYLR